MRTKIPFLFLFFSTFLSAQVEMTPAGFPAVEFQTPNRPVADLIEIAKGWASSYNKKGADVYDLTENTMTIDALRDNAYYYVNRGETHYFDIKYSLKVVFQENNTCKLTFSIKEFYDHGQVLKTTIADFFTPDGTLKQDFKDVKPSLENTASKIMNSFAGKFQN